MTEINIAIPNLVVFVLMLYFSSVGISVFTSFLMHNISIGECEKLKRRVSTLEQELSRMKGKP